MPSQSVTDPIFSSFLAQQDALLRAMERVNPGLFEILPGPKGFIVLQVRCKTLVRPPGQEPREVVTATIVLRIPDHYCRDVLSDQAIAFVMDPPFIFHPNVDAATGGICLGPVRPSTPVTDLVVRVFEILTFMSFATHDPLSPEAAEWVRHQPPERFPLEEDLRIHLPAPAAP